MKNWPIARRSFPPKRPMGTDLWLYDDGMIFFVQDLSRGLIIVVCWTIIIDDEAAFDAYLRPRQVFPPFCPFSTYCDHPLSFSYAPCSRKFQNVKLRLDFVEIWSLYRISHFTWNHILVHSYSPKLSFFAILETLNCDFVVNLSNFSTSNLPNFKIQSLWSCKKRQLLRFKLCQNWFCSKLNGK